MKLPCTIALALAALPSCAPSTPEPINVPAVAAPPEAPSPEATASASASARVAAPAPKSKSLGPFVQPSPTLSIPGASPAAPLSDAEARPLRPRLAARVDAEGAGMQHKAGPVAGRFRDGDVMELGLTLTPGRCYTVLGVAHGDIQELTLQLVAVPAPALPPMILALGTSQGLEATLGGGPGCFKYALPVPMPAILRMTAAKGRGIAGAVVLAR